MAFETTEELYGRNRKRCGARTRAGTPCKCKVVPGQNRCRLHVGLSTGPKAGKGEVIPINSQTVVQQTYPPKKEVPELKFDQKVGETATITAEAPDGTDGLPLLKRIFACEHDHSMDMLMEQLLLFKSHGESVDVRTGNRAIALIDEFAPRDALESTLAAQMVAVHISAMQCLRESTDPQKHAEARNLALRHGERLTSVFVRQLEALDKHRRNGEQKVVVQHVTVDNGSQAIVGDVSVDGARQGLSPGMAG